MRLEVKYDASEDGASIYDVLPRDTGTLERSAIAELLRNLVPRLEAKGRELLGDLFLFAKHFSFSNGEGLEFRVRVGTARHRRFQNFLDWIKADALRELGVA